jgi:hypothetical protein
MKKAIAVLLIMLFQLAAWNPNSNEQKGLDAIQQTRLQAHVDFLASDLLEDVVQGRVDPI